MDIKTENDKKEYDEIKKILHNINIINPESKDSWDFNDGINYEKILNGYGTMGIQASNFGIAVDLINKMISWRLSMEPISLNEDEDLKDMKVRENTRCTIFLGYTSNMVSSGNREIIRYLVEHKMVDCIVTTAGGIEEDFIKCLKPFYLGKFATENDKELEIYTFLQKTIVSLKIGFYLYSMKCVKNN